MDQGGSRLEALLEVLGLGVEVVVHLRLEQEGENALPDAVGGLDDEVLTLFLLDVHALNLAEGLRLRKTSPSVPVMDIATEQRLAGFEPFARFIVRKWGTAAGNVKAEDAAQEAMIEAWHVLEKDPTKPDAYVRTAMKFRVVEILGRNQSMTGQPPHPGRRDLYTTSLDAVIESEFGDETDGLSDPRDEEAVHVIDTGQLVRDAVGAQSEADRMLVWLRYWEDMEWKDVAAQMGITSGGARQRWMNKIRPTLRAAVEAAA